MLMNMATNEQKLNKVLEFWFRELTFGDWFTKSDEMDATIVERFSDLHAAIVAGEYDESRTSGKSILVQVIVLDQFSRNMFRGSSKSFVQDELALSLAQLAIEKGFEADLTPEERMFLYMPFMHSESKEIHKQAVTLFESLSMPSTLEYEHKHKEIIDRFGRYPHRNEVLGRESTPEEVEYLSSDEATSF